MNRRDLIRAAFAAGAYAWTLADGPARLWLPERKVIRETEYLVRAYAIEWTDAGKEVRGIKDLLVRPNAEPLVYTKTDLFPGFRELEITAWQLMPGRAPRRLNGGARYSLTDSTSLQFGSTVDLAQAYPWLTIRCA